MYGDHAALSTTITFLHLAGLVVGGGAAIATDRQILRAWRRGDARRQATLAEVSAVHAWVVGGLLVTGSTGALMLCADLHTFAGSPPFWWKMGSVGLLLANGGVLRWAEGLARRTDGARGWLVIGAASVISILLWMTTLFLGAYLESAA
jgi:hypothetical protein